MADVAPCCDLRGVLQRQPVLRHVDVAVPSAGQAHHGMGAFCEDHSRGNVRQNALESKNAIMFSFFLQHL